MKIRKKIISFFTKLKKNLANFVAWLTWTTKDEILILSKPVKNYSRLKITKRSLLGNCFYFFRPRDHKIHSPLNGRVKKIYLDNKTIILMSKKGLQVVLIVKIILQQNDSIFEIIKWIVKEDQEIKKGDILFIIYSRQKVLSIATVIPWQPLLIKKIDCFVWGRDDLAKIFFLNHNKDKPKIKMHGEYFLS